MSTHNPSTRAIPGANVDACSRQKLRQQLKVAYQANAEGCLRLAVEWFLIEEQACQELPSSES